MYDNIRETFARIGLRTISLNVIFRFAFQNSQSSKQISGDWTHLVIIFFSGSFCMILTSTIVNEGQTW